MQFLLYCLCGGIGVGTDCLVYFVALKSGVWYQAANIFGYVSGTVVSFILNRRITFAVKSKPAQRLAVFLGVAAVGLSVSAVMLRILIDSMQIDASIAKLCTLPVVVLLQFYLNRRITFNESVISE